MRLIPKFLNGTPKKKIKKRVGNIIYYEDGTTLELKNDDNVFEYPEEVLEFLGVKNAYKTPITEPSGGKEYILGLDNPVNKKLLDIPLDSDELSIDFSRLKPFPGVKIQTVKEEPNFLKKGLNGKLIVKPIPRPEDKNTNWKNGINFLNKLVPNILEGVRLKNTLNSNDRIARTILEGIRANQQQPYLTHRLVIGDEATKLAYYRRAAAGLTKAAQPFTSDADRLMAYLMEAKRVGDELRAQGDLADNLEIRRTSDESNQHQWANILRLTDVANYNSLERNKALASRKLIEALKHLADYTSIDNFLYGVQNTASRNNLKLEAINDEILRYRLQSELLDDKEVTVARNELTTAIQTYGQTSLQALLASEKLQIARRNAYLRFLEKYRNEKYGNGIFISKKGSKLTLKDDLVYKTTKDAVEHFRKMSKMTDDSRVKNKSKKVKLIPHPKGKTRKYLLGGVGPFAVFRPFVMGGDQTIASGGESNSSSSSSSSSEKLTAIEKELLDLVKKLFTDVSSKGLPIDVNMIYKNISNLFQMKKLYGESLTTDDIAGLYLSSMQQLSQVQHSKNLYNEAREQMVKNNALGEFAVSAGGNYFAQDKNGKILEASLELIIEQGLNPLTNSQLLFMRETNPNMSFREGDYLLGNAANNAVSMPNITKYILELIGTIGNSEKTILGFSEVESDKIKLGLSILAGAPKGLYKIELFDKNSQLQVVYALNFIQSSLPDNYKAILDMHIYRSNKKGDSAITDRNLYILFMLNKGINEVSRPNVTPITGKASDKNKEEDLDKLGINSATQLLLGMSSPREFTFSIGNGNMFNGMARVSSITKDGNSMGADFAYSDIYKSDLHKNLDLDNASFGDIPINKALKDRIVVDNSTIAGVDLPYTTDRNGRIIPDFKMLNRIEEADLEILRAGINPETEPQKVNEIYAKHKLPIKYDADNRLTGNYKRFAVILATAIEDVFLSKDGLSSNGTLTLVSDEEEIDKYVEEMKKITGNKNFDLDKPGITIFGKGDKDIYKGSIFIPIIGDLVDAVSATGGLKAGNYDELRSKYLTKNYVEVPHLFVKQ